MTSISKSKLKANMLRIFRDIEESGEELIVTDHNRPVLRIQPLDRKNTVKKCLARFRAGLSTVKTSTHPPPMNGAES